MTSLESDFVLLYFGTSFGTSGAGFCILEKEKQKIGIQKWKSETMEKQKCNKKILKKRVNNKIIRGKLDTKKLQKYIE